MSENTQSAESGGSLALVCPRPGRSAGRGLGCTRPVGRAAEMLSRDQQNLLGALGSAMAADALLDRLRERGTLEGGRSAPQGGCWISYNRKAVWLEDHSGFSEAMREAGTDKDAWRRIRPKVVLKVTWAEVAAYGATLPQELRTELDTLRRTERDENRSWSEFSDARGGWPWRRRFDSDEEHQEAQAEWDEVYGKHLVALRDVWDRQKAAISRALPLTVDDEPVDLLELLDQQPAAPAAPTHSAALQAGALRAAATTAPSPTVAPDERGELMNHNEPKRAACAGMHELFDSTHPSDHARAKAICNSPCPIKLQCAQWLKEDKASVGYDPRGTWSGRLVGKPVGRPGRGAVA